MYYECRRYGWISQYDGYDAQMGGAGGRPAPEDMIAKFDADGNGVLAASEVEGSRLADKFADVDGDGNGEVNQEELQAHFESMNGADETKNGWWWWYGYGNDVAKHGDSLLRKLATTDQLI